MEASRYIINTTMVLMINLYSRRNSVKKPKVSSIYSRRRIIILAYIFITLWLSSMQRTKRCTWFDS